MTTTKDTIQDWPDAKVRKLIGGAHDLEPGDIGPGELVEALAEVLRLRSELAERTIERERVKRERNTLRDLAQRARATCRDYQAEIERILQGGA